MQVLTLSEICAISGGYSNTNFDLTIAAKEGALCGALMGIPMGIIMGSAIALSVGAAGAPAATYTAALAWGFGFPVASIALGALHDTAFAYFKIPLDYVFYD